MRAGGHGLAAGRATGLVPGLVMGFVVLAMVACGGGSPDGRQVILEPAATVEVSGPAVVQIGQTIVWRVEMPGQPADDAPNGYRITLSESASKIAIETAECPPPAATGCQLWRITPSRDAVPGLYRIDVEPSGVLAPLTTLAQIEFEVRANVQAHLGNARVVATDGDSVFVITDDGRLHGRGENRSGQMAQGSLSLGTGFVGRVGPQVQPVAVTEFTTLPDAPRPSGWAAIAVAQGSVYALANETVQVWGSNAGRLGIASPLESRGVQVTPLALDALPPVRSVGSGAGGAMVVFADRAPDGRAGTAMSVGKATRAGLDDYFQPVTTGVFGAEPDRWLNDVAQVAGATQLDRPALLRQRDGSVWRWQSAQFARQVTGLPGAMAEVAVGAGPGDASQTYALARSDTGQVWWWRLQTEGTDGVPAVVPGLTGVRALHAGAHAWALRDDGTLWTWTPGGDAAPVQVPELAHVASMADGWAITRACPEGAGGLWRVTFEGNAPVARREARFGQACATDVPATVRVVVTGAGEVRSAPLGIACGGGAGNCVAEFDARGLVVLTAAPDAGQVLAGLPQGDCSHVADVGLVVQLRAGAVAECRIAFAPLAQRQLELQAIGPGVIERGSGICPSDCTATFGAESAVALTARPDAGARFVAWNGACTGSAQTVVLDFNVTTTPLVTCSATFEALPPAVATLRVAVTGGGQVTSAGGDINCGTVCSADFAVGTAVTLTAVPQPPMRFAGWQGACSGSAPSVTVTLQASITCQASFGYAPVNLVVNSSFEGPVAAGGLPTGAGYWRGDPTVTVGTEGGVTPVSGNGMLKFLATGEQASTRLLTSQLWQVVDLQPWRSQIAAGTVSVDASAWFNRVAGSATTDRRFDLRILAFDGSPADLPARYVSNSALAVAASTVDSVGLRWQPARLQLPLPAATRYVLVEIYAYEDVVNDGQSPEFDGHYADDVWLTLNLP
jgi:hypothetical protein